MSYSVAFSTNCNKIFEQTLLYSALEYVVELEIVFNSGLIPVCSYRTICAVMLVQNSNVTEGGILGKWSILLYAVIDTLTPLKRIFPGTK